MKSIFQKIIDLTKQLYPSGRAWRMPILSIMHRLHEGLALSEEQVHNDIKGNLDSALPDNENFSLDDALRWESALGLITNLALTLEERKNNILQKINFPGGIKARQHYLYIEGQLRDYGFDVYLHENRFPTGGGNYEVNNPISAFYENFTYGDTSYGNAGLGDISFIANSIDENDDAGFNFGSDINLRFTFFVGGVTFGTRADVDATRKREFRDLLLKLKPAHTAGFLQIDYI